MMTRATALEISQNPNDLVIGFEGPNQRNLYSGQITRGPDHHSQMVYKTPFVFTNKGRAMACMKILIERTISYAKLVFPNDRSFFKGIFSETELKNLREDPEILCEKPTPKEVTVALDLWCYQKEGRYHIGSWRLADENTRDKNKLVLKGHSARRILERLDRLHKKHSFLFMIHSRHKYTGEWKVEAVLPPQPWIMRKIMDKLGRNTEYEYHYNKVKCIEKPWQTR
jgi:hypothetical protein